MEHVSFPRPTAAVGKSHLCPAVLVLCMNVVLHTAVDMISRGKKMKYQRTRYERAKLEETESIKHDCCVLCLYYTWYTLAFMTLETGFIL